MNAKVAGMMAYTKTPEDGPATIDAVGIQFSDTTSEALAQTGSEIRIDGAAITPVELDVEKLYKSFMKKGAR
jgi:hypothetical protein